MSSTDKQLVGVALEDGWLNDICNRIDQIVELRLIEKISRPIHIAIKQKLIQAYIRQINQLNTRINHLKNNLHNNNSSKNNLTNTNTSKYNVKSNSKQFFKSVSQIQAKYYEAFFTGSIKHFKKLASIYGFKQNIQFINIQQWSKSCRSQNQVNDDFCC